MKTLYFILVKERKFWREFGLADKEQRQFARMWVALFAVAFILLVWLWLEHREFCRWIVLRASSIVFFLYVLISGIKFWEYKDEKAQASDWQDVDMSVYGENGDLLPHAYSKSVPAPVRKTIMHTDGKEIEVVDENEIDKKKREIDSLRKKAEKRDIDFEIQ